MSKGKGKGPAAQPAKAGAVVPAAGAKAAPVPQHLARKPADNKLYDTLSYKQGIKACESLLAKYPEDGESLSMKALFISGLPGRKEEAYELARKGLRFSMKSHVPWHIFGLLYRADGNYDQAIRSYLNALVHDPKNSTILRDLALLQLQIRDVSGLEVTRARILDMKKSQKGNWLAYAIALHMNGNFPKALAILKILQQSFSSHTEEDGPELSERVMEESGDVEGALAHLKSNRKIIKDRVAYLEKQAGLNMKLNRFPEALRYWKKLLLRNPDNLNYHAGVAKALELPEIGQVFTDAQVEALQTFWKDIREAHPRSPTFDGVSLSCLSGASFQALFQKKFCEQLRKGIPSLFGGMKHLYQVPARAEIIETVILNAEKTLREQGVLPDSTPDKGLEPPTTLLWLFCYLACHFNERQQFDRALAYIQEAHNEHTPTMHELYMIKANILKHAGAIKEASAQLEIARKLDTADRFLNTKSVKYLLTANQAEEATTVVQLFTKDNDDFEPSEKGQTYLDYMQAMWWESRLAACYHRTGDFKQALRLNRVILAHFKGIQEDQFDFHNYVLRKMTLRAYLQLLRFEDHIFSHKQYRLAARSAIKLALKLVKNPAPVEPVVAVADAKKAGKKEEKVDEKDLPPTLDTFVPELKNLLLFAAEDLETQTLAAKLYQARNKPLLALRALKAALRLDKDHPSVLIRASSFLQYVATLKEVNPVVAETIKLEVEALNLGTPETILAKLKSNTASQGHRVAAAKLAALSGDASSALALLKDLTNANLAGSRKALKYLSRVGSEADVQAFKAEGRKVFPLADIFAPPAEPTEPVVDNSEFAE